MSDGKVVIEGEDLTVRDLIDHLQTRYGPALTNELLDRGGDIRQGLCFLVNGRNILSLPGRYQTPLQDGDEVLIALVVGGG
jgi:molybdopterin converting factor small subunit